MDVKKVKLKIKDKLRKQMIQTDISNWIMLCAERGFPRTYSKVLSEVKVLLQKHELLDLVSPEKFADEIISQQNFEKSTVVCLNNFVNLFLLQHNYFTNYFKKHKMVVIFTEPSRIYSLSLATYSYKSQNNMKQKKVIHTIAANGTCLKPLVFIEKDESQVHLEQLSFYTTTKETDKDNPLLYYIKNVLLPHIQEGNIKLPIVLFMDGLDSFVTLEVQNLCKKFKVHLISLFPTCSVITSPFIVSIFPELVKNFNQIQRKVGFNIRKKVNFADIFVEALKATNLKSPEIIELIKNAFADMGMCPFSQENADILNIWDHQYTQKLSTSEKFIVNSSRNQPPAFNNFTLKNSQIEELEATSDPPVPTTESYSSSSEGTENECEVSLESLKKLDEQIYDATNLLSGNSGAFLMKVYKTIFLSTFAGICIHYPSDKTTSKFKDVYRTTKKVLLAVDTEKCIKLSHLLRWHMDCERYLRYLKVFDVLSDPSRIVCFDTFAFEMDKDSSIVLSDFQGSKTSFGMAVCADGSVLKPYLRTYLGNRTLSTEFSTHYMIHTQPSQEFEVYMMKLENEMRKKVKFPIIVFLNPYKLSIKASAFVSCLKKGIILVGCYPNSHKNFNPLEMAIGNILIPEVIEASNETKHSINSLCDMIMNIAKSDLKTIKIKQSFAKMGIYPWSKADIDCQAFKQCERFSSSFEKVDYICDKFISCTLNICSEYHFKFVKQFQYNKESPWYCQECNEHVVDFTHIDKHLKQQYSTIIKRDFSNLVDDRESLDIENESGTVSQVENGAAFNIDTISFESSDEMEVSEVGNMETQEPQEYFNVKCAEKDSASNPRKRTGEFASEYGGESKVPKLQPTSDFVVKTIPGNNNELFVVKNKNSKSLQSSAVIDSTEKTKTTPAQRPIFVQAINVPAKNVNHKNSEKPQQLVEKTVTPVISTVYSFDFGQKGLQSVESIEKSTEKFFKTIDAPTHSESIAKIKALKEIPSSSSRSDHQFNILTTSRVKKDNIQSQASGSTNRGESLTNKTTSQSMSFRNYYPQLPNNPNPQKVFIKNVNLNSQKMFITDSTQQPTGSIEPSSDKIFIKKPAPNFVYRSNDQMIIIDKSKVASKSTQATANLNPQNVFSQPSTNLISKEIFMQKPGPSLVVPTNQQKFIFNNSNQPKRNTQTTLIFNPQMVFMPNTDSTQQSTGSIQPTSKLSSDKIFIKKPGTNFVYPNDQRIVIDKSKEGRKRIEAAANFNPQNVFIQQPSTSIISNEIYVQKPGSSVFLPTTQRKFMINDLNISKKATAHSNNQNFFTGSSDSTAITQFTNHMLNRNLVVPANGQRDLGNELKKSANFNQKKIYIQSSGSPSPFKSVIMPYTKLNSNQTFIRKPEVNFVKVPSNQRKFMTSSSNEPMKRTAPIFKKTEVLGNKSMQHKTKEQEYVFVKRHYEVPKQLKED